MTVDAPAAAGSSASPTIKGRKWIAQEIADLNPQADYARIWALTTIYYGDDMLVNLLYAVGMPCFTQSPYGSHLLVERSRKVKERADERAWDTLAHFWRWFEYGPEHIEAQRSIEMVNRIHGAMWKLVEPAFANDDFIYTTAWLGTYLHRLRRLVGLNGFNEKQQTAAHLFWRNVMSQMRGPHGEIHDYPANFTEMLAFVLEFEGRDWEPVESGRELGHYAVKQFCEAQMPKPLWPLGRQIVLTVQAPRVRKLHQMGEPNPVAAWLIKRTLFLKIRLAERYLPDPRENTAERARAAGDVEGQHREPRMIPPSACPFHAALDTSKEISQ
ncbi:DUF2236 domain-containing protein [Mycolicibacterium neoaurum]|uniref:oxygenase MpaB family protein n=1 Tax=Mycolicibacterium neoaurum TaxID=1795 RepID=UPI001BD01B8E|nr:oxygenase MpaB family protein [Mycolicibacterium neoaurum]QVI27272.1 DUF2236 domain-containing protein [Mycolicibacterium neoaurum]